MQDALQTIQTIILFSKKGKFDIYDIYIDWKQP